MNVQIEAQETKLDTVRVDTEVSPVFDAMRLREVWSGKEDQSNRPCITSEDFKEVGRLYELRQKISDGADLEIEFESLFSVSMERFLSLLISVLYIVGRVKLRP